MKILGTACAFAMMAWATVSAADGDIVKVKATSDVATTMDNLEAAVNGAGATVFARVDHGAGAVKVGVEMGDSQLLIFGNPKMGAPAMQLDPLAGLYLPLKVLVYADADGQVWLAYEEPAETLEDLAIPKDAEFLKKMTGALGKLTGKAAGS